MDQPRAYVIESNSGIFRRNKWHLILAPYYTKRKFTPTYTSLDNDQSGNYCNNDSFKITESAKVNPPVNSEIASAPGSIAPGIYEFCSAKTCDSPNVTDESSSQIPRRNVQKPRYLEDCLNVFIFTVSFRFRVLFKFIAEKKFFFVCPAAGGVKNLLEGTRCPVHR